jgi:hypothetical protein
MPKLTRLLSFSALSAALALAACNRGDEGNLASLDNQLVGNDADPALTSALQDQILVDPSLANQSNRAAVRPAETPTQAQYPAAQPGAKPAPTAGPQKAGGGTATPAAQHAPLANVAGGQGGAACGGSAAFDYNPAWANRMSAAFPLYPGAKVSDAAGHNEGGCRMRVVTFTTGDGFQRILDWHNTRAVRAGYSSEHQIRGGDHVLAGTNPADGGAFYLIVTPGETGSEAALIANNGR